MNNRFKIVSAANDFLEDALAELGAVLGPECVEKNPHLVGSYMVTCAILATLPEDRLADQPTPDVEKA